MIVSLSLLAGAGWQFFNDNGSPLSGGLLFTYRAGTTTPQTTYTDSSGTVANPNPIVLDSAGRISQEIWLNSEYTYKFVLKTPASVPIWTKDNIPGYGSSADIAFVPAGTGATSRTVQDKLRDTVSVKDFGAVGDGVTNDTAAFEAMVSFCAASGAIGLVPTGTYLIDPSTRTFSGSLPFVIKGEGRGASILKNRNAASRFIYWTGAHGAAIEDLSIDGSFTGLPSVPTSGGTLVLISSNNNTIRNVDFINVWRVAILVFNDHQTTLTNVYSGFVADNVRVFGPSNYIDNVGPSAILVADYNNSRIQNCYIENIGQYGYEYKNDCNNNLIDNCVAIRAYRAIYFGGDGPETALLYVKNSVVSNCVIVDAQEAVSMGLANNNLVTNCEIRTTASGPTPVRGAINIDTGVGNTCLGMVIVNRKAYACDIRDTSLNNCVEFVLVDGAYTGEAVLIAADSTGNKATVSWKNHDTIVLNSLRFTTQNTVIDQRNNYNYSYSSVTNPRIENALTNSRPPYFSTVKGRVQFGDTFDVHTNTNQASLYENFGDYTNAILSQVRHKFDTGVKIETIWAAGGASSVSYTKDQNGFAPGTDNTLRLGAPAARWTTVFATTGTINTSDAREKQQVRGLTNAERAVAIHLKSMVRAFKWNAAVEKKNSAARIHFGLMAQDVITAFENEGLDPFAYAVVCYDEWPETLEERDADGTVTQEYRPAGNRYGVRYEELLAFIITAL